MPAPSNPDAARQRIARALAAEHKALRAAIERLAGEGKSTEGLERLAEKISEALAEAERKPDRPDAKT